MLSKKEILESGLIEQYVLGVASDEDVHEVERCAEFYPEVKMQIQELQGSLESYCKAHMMKAPAALKAKVLQGIRPTEVKPLRSAGRQEARRFSLYNVAASIAILLLGSAAVYFYQQQNKTNERLALLTAEFQSIQNRYTQLGRLNDQLQSEAVLVRDIQTRHVMLQGSEHAPDAKVVVYWNNDRQQSSLNIVEMPVAPAAHQYQVWAVIDGKHVNMGLINRSPKDQLHPLPYMEKCTGFVITLEKEGGSIHPTTDQIYMQGEI